ncbi:MAG: adenosine deaminase [Bacteroidia bacterium]
MNDILDLIRPNRSALFGFFSMMPKGGDLHHHYSGSVYTESYIDYIFQKDVYVNERTMEISIDIANLSDEIKKEWKKISQVENKDKLKLELLRLWSVKDFVKGAHSSDEHFFSTFPAFTIPSKANYIENLKELKKRALNQKLSYLETIFISADTRNIKVTGKEDIDKRCLGYQANKDEASLFVELDQLYQKYHPAVKIQANVHTDNIEALHSESGVEDEDFVLRFQNYVARYKQPVDLFIDLFTCFHSCNDSKLISGVNIVAAENGETAMRDYWLHTMFFKFLEKKYPDVRYAIHAGELVGGMVQPENLGTHIRQSLVLNNLKRIGHAVDIIYDNEFTSTIRKLQEKQIAIEINLSSNEFILSVSHDLHPVEIYYTNNIPIVICTDDEGVLRTSITEQYVLLAHRYKLTYSQIKEVVKNSIVYSHLENNNVRQRLLKKLEKDFEKFEKEIFEFYQPIVSPEGNFEQLKFQSKHFL